MIKLGAIGFGSRINQVVRALVAHDPEFHVTGVVDPDAPGVRARLPEADRADARFYPTLSALVRKGRPDALAIGTRCDLHARYATDAAAAGLPLFLEKPIATSLRQARALEHAWHHAKAEVVVSFPFRGRSLGAEVKRRLDAGAVGRVEHLLGVNYAAYGATYFESWYRDYAITQGLFLQSAIHDFDLLSFLAGAPVVRVAAMLARGRVHRDKSLEPPGGDPDAAYYPHIGTPETGMNEDASSALLEFANGAQGVFTQVFYTRGSAAARRGATISGLRGTLNFDWHANSLEIVPHAAGSRPEKYQPPQGSKQLGGDVGLVVNFSAVVRGQARSATPLRTGLESVYTSLAAQRSASTGRFVRVPVVTEV